MKSFYEQLDWIVIEWLGNLILWTSSSAAFKEVPGSRILSGFTEKIKVTQKKIMFIVISCTHCHWISAIQFQMDLKFYFV